MSLAQRSPRLPRWLPWALAGLLAASAQAGTVYRCGSVYQDQPCAGAQRLELNDERNPEQQQAREQATRDEQHLADRLAAERRQREKTLKPQTQAVGVPVHQLTVGDDARDGASNPCGPGVEAARRRQKQRITCRNGQPLYVQERSYVVPAARSAGLQR